MLHTKALVLENFCRVLPYMEAMHLSRTILTNLFPHPKTFPYVTQFESEMFENIEGPTVEAWVHYYLINEPTAQVI